MTRPSAGTANGPELPDRVTIGCREFVVQESEGLIVFRETRPIYGFEDRLAFRRDGSNRWHVEIASSGGGGARAECDVATILQAYRYVEAVYAGPFGGRLGEDGRARPPFGTAAAGWSDGMLSEQDQST